MARGVNRKQVNTEVDFGTFLSQILISAPSQIGQTKVPDYPFFGELVSYILDLGRKTGARPIEALRKIKKSFMKEEIFKKRVKKIVLEGYIQFFLITSMTWAMIFSTEYLEIVKIDSSFKFIILLLQASAYCLYYPVFCYFKNLKVSFICSFLKKLYIFQINTQSSLPLKKAYEQSKLKSSFKQNPRRFKIYLNRLESLISNFQRRGGQIQEELENLKEELWNEYSLILEELEKVSQVLKLSLIFTLLLPSYFIYLYALIDSFIL